MTKPMSIFCGASLVLNAALLFLLASGATSDAKKTTALNTSPNNAPVSSAATANSAIESTTWSSLKTDELPALLARLREAGFPADVIRAIIASQVSELFAARRKALDPDAATRPYWKNRPRDPKIDAASRRLNREQEKMVRDLTGRDTESGYDAFYQDRQLEGVPSEKRDDVMALIRDFNDRRMDIYGGGVISPLDRTKLSTLEKEQHDAMAKILSPTELADYDLRTSNTSNSLRYELTAFNPTEEEFRALHALKRPFDEQYSNYYGSGPMSQEQIRQRSDAQTQLEEQIKSALGPDRYSDYQRSTDYNYRQASQLVARLELPPETTNQLWDVQKDIQQRSKDVYSDKSLAAEERTQKLTALAEEAKAKITTSLGAQGFEAYKQYGGQWMQQLQPRGNGAAQVIRSSIP